MANTNHHMRIGILSDTHGHAEAVGLAVEAFRRGRVELVIHCGDIGSLEVIELLTDWPTHFVLGNVDSRAVVAQAIEDVGQTCHGRFGELELAGRKIAFLHGDDGQLLNQTIRGGQWDVVFHGHTHSAKQANVGSTLVVNPGALYGTPDHSVAIVELPSLAVQPIWL